LWFGLSGWEDDSERDASPTQIRTPAQHLSFIRHIRDFLSCLSTPIVIVIYIYDWQMRLSEDQNSPSLKRACVDSPLNSPPPRGSYSPRNNLSPLAVDRIQRWWKSDPDVDSLASDVDVQVLLV
jgi:hypothetical protein